MLSTKLFVGCCMLVCVSCFGSVGDPLPSWNEGPSKTAIVEFVKAVTDETGEDYVAPKDRIATFDNDGTLWVESPAYTQLYFARDAIVAGAEENPEWKTTQPFQGVLEGDLDSVIKTGEEGIMELMKYSHTGMTSEEFKQAVTSWFQTAKQERFDRPYTDLIYQPMLELLDYLRANEFETYIVSGGGLDFIRTFSEQAYGIPPSQVIGSTVKMEYKVVDGEPVLVRLPEISFIDDKAGKPVGISAGIGSRPILAFGNSDGDFEMVEYTTAGGGRRLGLFVHHTDGEREYSYDREGHVGVLDKALDVADDKGWVIVDMKEEWNRIFPFDA